MGRGLQSRPRLADEARADLDAVERLAGFVPRRIGLFAHDLHSGIGTLGGDDGGAITGRILHERERLAEAGVATTAANKAAVSSFFIRGTPIPDSKGPADARGPERAMTEIGKKGSENNRECGIGEKFPWNSTRVGIGNGQARSTIGLVSLGG